MRAVSRLIGLGGSYSAAAGCASVALLLITLTNGAYVSLEAQDIPTACTVDRGTPIAASISGAVEARNSVITRDADNLKAMVAGGRFPRR
jgi:hypothetical protein